MIKYPRISCSRNLVGLRVERVLLGSFALIKGIFVGQNAFISRGKWRAPIIHYRYWPKWSSLIRTSKCGRAIEWGVSWPFRPTLIKGVADRCVLHYSHKSSLSFITVIKTLKAMVSQWQVASLGSTLHST